MIAVDGSETSSRALREGIALAKQFETPLRIVHVIENAYVRVGPAEGINVEPIAQAWREAGQKVLDEAAHRLAAPVSRPRPRFSRKLGGSARWWLMRRSDGMPT